MTNEIITRAINDEASVEEIENIVQFFQDKLEEKKSAKVVVEKLPLGMSAMTSWLSPRLRPAVSVQDLIDSLNIIKDKSLIVSWELRSDDSSDWGEIETIKEVIVRDSDNEEGYDCNQVVLSLSSNV